MRVTSLLAPPASSLEHFWYRDEREERIESSEHEGVAPQKALRALEVALASAVDALKDEPDESRDFVHDDKLLSVLSWVKKVLQSLEIPLGIDDDWAATTPATTEITAALENMVVYWDNE